MERSWRRTSAQIRSDEVTARPADIIVGEEGWPVDLGGHVEVRHLGFGQTKGDLYVLWNWVHSVVNAPATYAEPNK